MTPSHPFIAARLRTVTRLSLGLGIIVQVLSYLLPMAGYRGQLWGEMYWMKLPLRLFNAVDWSLREGLLLLLYLPLMVLLYLLVRWYRIPNPTQKLPKVRWLLMGLILPNLVIPLVALYEWMSSGRSLVRQEMVAYFIWNASFWLIFYGLWCYIHQHRSTEKTLLDHLIDEK